MGRVMPPRGENLSPSVKIPYTPQISPRPRSGARSASRKAPLSKAAIANTPSPKRTPSSKNYDVSIALAVSNGFQEQRTVSRKADNPMARRTQRSAPASKKGMSPTPPGTPREETGDVPAPTQTPNAEIPSGASSKAQVGNIQDSQSDRVSPRARPRTGINFHTNFHGHTEKIKLQHEISENLDQTFDKETVVHFCYWLRDHEVKKALFEFFWVPYETGKLVHYRAVPVGEFVSYIKRNGFDGDTISITREILKFAPPSTKAQLKNANVDEPDYEVTMPMLQRFLRNFERINAGLEWSPFNEFKKTLFEKRGGSYLRAWRLDVDLFSTGSVAYMAFCHACSQLKLGHQAQTIWNALRPDVNRSPLEFHEFAPEEARNLEEFSEILWVSCEFNMLKAWEIIDANQIGWVSEQEFVTGARELGFKGDAVMIHKGLDSYGLGRLWKRELEYLKILFEASMRTPHGMPQIRILRAWAIQKFLFPNIFVESVAKVLMRAASNMKLKVAELVPALEKLGFPGDSKQAALEIGAAAPIPDEITGKVLKALLAGERPVAGPHILGTLAAQKSLVRQKNTKKARSTTPPRERKPWNDKLDISGDRNEKKFHQNRSYFSSPSVSLVRGEYEEQKKFARS